MLLNDGFKRQLIFIAAIQGFLTFDGLGIPDIGYAWGGENCLFSARFLSPFLFLYKLSAILDFRNSVH